jgi:hypothetical protein
MSSMCMWSDGQWIRRCSEKSAQFLLEDNCAKSDDNKPALLVPKVVCS